MDHLVWVFRSHWLGQSDLLSNLSRRKPKASIPPMVYDRVWGRLLYSNRARHGSITPCFVVRGGGYCYYLFEHQEHYHLRRVRQDHV